MPNRPNTESRLISALINTQDADAATMYGVTADMFVTYQSEYRWLVDFPKTYGHQPSADSLMTRYKDFPYSEEYTDVGFICDEVKEKHQYRKMVSALQGAGEALRAGDTDTAYAYFSSIQHPGNSTGHRLVNVLTDFEFLDTYHEKVERIDVPWKTLQQVTGGPAAGDNWVIAARLGQGKSWTLGSIATKALLDGRKVIYYSMEMPTDQLRSRIHSQIAPEIGVRVKHSDLHGRSYDPILYRKLVQQIKEQVPGELFVVDTSKGGINTATIASTCKGMDLVIIDYLGLMGSPFGGRAVDDWRTMAAISNILKEIAISEKVPIISAAQINREGDTSGWKPPKVKNLSQSDAIGQDADVVLTMKKRSKRVAIYSVEKNRHGDSGDLFHTRFQPNDGRFEEIGIDVAKDLMIEDAEREDME